MINKTSKLEELIILSYSIDPDPSRNGEVNIIFKVDSIRISALKDGRMASSNKVSEEVLICWKFLKARRLKF